MIQITYGPVFSGLHFDHAPHLESWVYGLLTTINPEDSRFEFFYDPYTRSYPTGLTNYLCRHLAIHQIPVELHGFPAGETFQPDPEIFNFGPDPITLREDQVQSVSKALSQSRGVLWIGTGGGKTEIATYMMLHLDRKSLFIVSTAQSMNDTAERFQKRIDAAFQGGKIDRKPSVGRIGEGTKEFEADIVVALVESLYRGLRAKAPQIVEFLESVEVLIYDECHHESTAATWKEVGIACTADYRYGLSATPFDHPHDPNVLHHQDSQIVAMTGDVLVYVPEIYLISKGALTRPYIRFFPGGGKVDGRITDWNEVYTEGVVDNVRRNARFATVTANAVKCGGRVLLSVQRLRHGIEFLRLLQYFGILGICSYGSDKTYIPNCPELVQHAPWVTGESKTYPGFVYVATSKFPMMDLYEAGIAPVIVGNIIYDESKDIPILTDFVNAGAGRKHRRIQQKIGRSLRRHTFKRVAKVWDANDTCHGYLQAQTVARGEHAESLGYEVIWHDRLMSEHLMTFDWLKWTVQNENDHSL